MNLGNQSEFQILELAEKITILTNSRCQILFKELPQDDPVRRQPDIAYFDGLLGRYG